ncbi:hypothetical protein A9D14_06595 [Croceicoccus marinus]|uniref:Uncharacterized protein n=1 Tax=Croceicoccus marinus TaxID=450378 RepID=A0A1Z1FAZ0_9SPHN|nr:hypothetical protein [Croceicoccus marinus]ARU15912.1 hypothetical protein A9D14_06595 [Croceicoccus marinus]
MLILLFAAAIVPSGQTFECTPIRVWDGDGPIWCAEGPRIRVSGVAARETDGTCRPGHPCPDADPETAKSVLVDLVGVRTGTSREGHALVKGPTMHCISTGSAGGNRTGAWCVSPKSGDISCALVASGAAARWDRYWGNHRCRDQP